MSWGCGGALSTFGCKISFLFVILLRIQKRVIALNSKSAMNDGCRWFEESQFNDAWLSADAARSELLRLQ